MSNQEKMTYKEWRARRLRDRSADPDTPDYKVDLELVKEYERYLNGELNDE